MLTFTKRSLDQRENKSSSHVKNEMVNGESIPSAIDCLRAAGKYPQHLLGPNGTKQQGGTC